MALTDVEMNATPLSSTDYNLYDKIWAEEQVASIDNAAEKIGPLLKKGETAINKELQELALLDPGQLDQSRLMQAQMNMSRWQLAAQLLSNFLSGVASGLKNTVQNVGR